MRTQADRDDDLAIGRELERKDAEIERLQEAKRRALAIADERSKEACELRAALQGVVSDVLEYEKVNNLAPNPGRRYCWDSVARAIVVLGNEQSTNRKEPT